MQYQQNSNLFGMPNNIYLNSNYQRNPENNGRRSPTISTISHSMNKLNNRMNNNTSNNKNKYASAQKYNSPIFRSNLTQRTNFNKIIPCNINVGDMGDNQNIKINLNIRVSDDGGVSVAAGTPLGHNNVANRQISPRFFNQGLVSNSRSIPKSMSPSLYSNNMSYRSANNHLQSNNYPSFHPYNQRQYNQPNNIPIPSVDNVQIGPIEQQQIFCVICNQSYTLTEKQTHKNKHIRIGDPTPKQHTLGSKIKQSITKSVHTNNNSIVTRPIVQPEEFNIPYTPNKFIIQHQKWYSTENERQKISQAIGTQLKGRQMKIEATNAIIESLNNNNQENIQKTPKIPINYVQSAVKVDMDSQSETYVPESKYLSNKMYYSITRRLNDSNLFQNQYQQARKSTIKLSQPNLSKYGNIQQNIVIFQNYSPKQEPVLTQAPQIHLQEQRIQLSMESDRISIQNHRGINNRYQSIQPTPKSNKRSISEHQNIQQNLDNFQYYPPKQQLILTQAPPANPQVQVIQLSMLSMQSGRMSSQNLAGPSNRYKLINYTPPQAHLKQSSEKSAKFRQLFVSNLSHEDDSNQNILDELNRIQQQQQQDKHLSLQKMHTFQHDQNQFNIPENNLEQDMDPQSSQNSQIMSKIPQKETLQPIQEIHYSTSQSRVSKVSSQTSMQKPINLSLEQQSYRSHQRQIPTKSRYLSRYQNNNKQSIMQLKNQFKHISSIKYSIQISSEQQSVSVNLNQNYNYQRYNEKYAQNMQQQYNLINGSVHGSQRSSQKMKSAKHSYFSSQCPQNISVVSKHSSQRKNKTQPPQNQEQYHQQKIKAPLPSFSDISDIGNTKNENKNMIRSRSGNIKAKWIESVTVPVQNTQVIKKEGHQENKMKYYPIEQQSQRKGSKQSTYINKKRKLPKALFSQWV